MFTPKYIFVIIFYKSRAEEVSDLPKSMELHLKETRMAEFLEQIDKIFHDSQVEEVGYMMDTEGPVVCYSDKNLGISTTIVKPLYKFALVKLSALTKRLNNYSTVTDFQDDLISLSRILLIVKGDLPMAFKSRKLLIESSLLSIDYELRFLKTLFYKHPKTPSAWFHRRWCLELNRQRLGRVNFTFGEIETERELCRDLCERSPKNYYAWTHRQWLLSFMTNIQVILLHHIYIGQIDFECFYSVGERTLVYERLADVTHLRPLGQQPSRAGGGAYP
jgi:hypothetical protein